jgi:hypothetical protein
MLRDFSKEQGGQDILDKILTGRVRMPSNMRARLGIHACNVRRKSVNGLLRVLNSEAERDM